MNIVVIFGLGRVNILKMSLNQEILEKLGFILGMGPGGRVLNLRVVDCRRGFLFCKGKVL